MAEFIITRWGADALVALIATNGNLAMVTGLSAAEFMTAWRGFVRSQYGV